MTKKKIAFYTFGCKLNFSETSSIVKQFPENEFEIVDFKDFADIYVIHSCSVTAVAEKKCRAVIRQAARRNPNAAISVMGCYSQLKPDELAKMDGVKWVLGNTEKYRLAEIIRNECNEPDHQVIDHLKIASTKEFVSSYSIDDRTRSFLKVQDGCDYFCTYCAIPFARGRSRSDNVKDTVAKAQLIARTKIKEIVLTGVNIGEFGKDWNESFLDLIMALDEIEGIERYRISSIEPNLLTNEIIEFVAQSKRFSPHFHIPLQSGSDKILQMMKRRYHRADFVNRVAKVRELMPHACVAADVIVGFPGETEEDFLDIYRFIEELDIAYLHVFPYSIRPGTKAATLPGQLSNTEKEERSRRLHLLSDEKKELFYKANKGRKVSTLWEADTDNGMMFGYTENYIRTKTPYRAELLNTFTEGILDELDENCVYSVQFTGKSLGSI
ncbi:MAG: tRNA (N(6)-L-threonylcarbamoyladenosine(37)-C(2))-methylthiotransferase MtaB [Bacteroidota bacterium]|nr:tRNA (N(6)-L-threonylcarbamoyladenosine(37)-C(2))-methylthiotransferase MtaB [Bacteroidota bacterium]